MTGCDFAKSIPSGWFAPEALHLLRTAKVRWTFSCFRSLLVLPAWDEGAVSQTASHRFGSRTPSNNASLGAPLRLAESKFTQPNGARHSEKVYGSFVRRIPLSKAILFGGGCGVFKQRI